MSPHPCGTPKMANRLPFVLTLLAACGLAAPAAAADAPCTPRSVSVSGEGSASAAPGVYVFHIAVSRRGTDIPAANKVVDGKVTAALNAARRAGIAKADMQSTSVAINPVYDPNAKPDTPQTYEVTRNVTLTLRQPARYAALVEGLIGAGVNRFANIEARPDDPQALADRALAAAVANARHKAALVAQGLGVALGPALELDESGQGPRPLVMGAMQARSAQAGGYEPGEITAQTSVTARFALAPSGCPGN